MPTPRLHPPRPVTVKNLCVIYSHPPYLFLCIQGSALAGWIMFAARSICMTEPTEFKPMLFKCQLYAFIYIAVYTYYF